ncbi:MAG: hypothetical protein J0L86_02625 [Flavobacteriales bacterium]|nr:hypothetical protein [Flavobacteriales bacterium]
MRAKIKTTNLSYFLRQEYGFSSIEQFFELTKYGHPLRNKAILSMINEFTGYKIEGDSLVTYNPYTDKNERIKLKNFDHINSKEELLKDLFLLHKTRMQMLEQSRDRIVEISKEQIQKRDEDLKITQEKRITRHRELPKKKLNLENDLER